MNTLIDTHCHITCDALYERIDEVLENARQAGIEKMLIICTDFTEYERAQQLKEREPRMRSTRLWNACLQYRKRWDSLVPWH